MIALQCHPESPGRAVRGIHIEAQRKPGSLLLTYRIEAEMADVLLSPKGSRPLWRHTCCEAFVARPGSPAYHEFNFSPSGDWAAYAFTDYRQGEPVDAPDPGIAVRALSGMLELRACIAPAPGRLLLALTAVVEERDGALSYWALRHAPGKPDFHRRDAFVLELP